MAWIFPQYKCMIKLPQKKYVRIALKIIGALTILMTVLMLVADAYIHSHKEEISQKIRTLLSQSIDGQVNIKDVDVSLLATFPYAGINILGTTVLDSQYHRPMLKAGYASVRISLFQLLNPHPEVSKIVIRNGTFHFFTDTTGYTNAYLLLKKNQPQKNAAPSLIIHKIEFANVSALIEDAKKNKRYDFTFNNLDASINKDDSTYTIKMSEEAYVRGLGFNLDRGSYLDSQTVNSNKWILKFNAASHDLSFGETNIVVNGFRYAVSGDFHLRDSANFHLRVSTSNVPYKKILELLTVKIRSHLKDLGIEGPVDAEADLKGDLAYLAQPLVVIKCSTKGNQIITPIASFTDCSFTGMFTNRAVDSLPASDENSIVLINNFKGSWGEIQLNADSIRLTNIVDPRIKFNFFSKCNFETLNDQLSFESIDFTGGTAQLYLRYAGPLMASPELLSKLTAAIQLQDVSLVYVPRDLSFSHCSGSVIISENNVAVDNLRCDLKGNHFEINASASNVNGHASRNMAKASVQCNVFTPSIDLDDFRVVFSPRKIKNHGKKSKSNLAATADKIDDILNNGDLQMNIKANHVNLKNFNADNVVAQVLFHGDDWEIQKADLIHAGGRLSITSSLHQVNANYHMANAKLNAQNVDVRKLFYAFDNFGLDDLTYHNLKGTVNANADLAFATNNDGRVIPGTMQGAVDFSIKNGALVNFIPIEKLQGIAFLSRDLSNITFAELKNKLTIKGSEIEIPRMEIASSAITMYVGGVYSLKNKTDISIQVPLSNLARKDSAYKPVNKGPDARVGPSIWLRAKSDETGKIKIGLQLFGKHKKDKDTTSSK
jgi:hypothetical protein